MATSVLQDVQVTDTIYPWMKMVIKMRVHQQEIQGARCELLLHGVKMQIEAIETPCSVS